MKQTTSRMGQRNARKILVSSSEKKELLEVLGEDNIKMNHKEIMGGSVD
jgi:hypothetical protein